MSQRLEKSKVVHRSIENSDHDRCVDLFQRADQSFGFEEFRRDPEDGGVWTTVHFYSSGSYSSLDLAMQAAGDAVIWLCD